MFLTTGADWMSNVNMKVHRVPGKGDVVAVCDSELLDRTLRHGHVDVPITRGFYGDCAVTEDEVRAVLKDACNINLFGRRTVALAKEMGLVEDACCLEIDGIPHAQVFII